MGPPDKLTGPERLVLAWLALAAGAGVIVAVVRVVETFASRLAILTVRAGGRP